MRARAAEFLNEVQTRRSVRHFSADAVPRDAILDCIRAAGQAPSGANKQPWTFVLVTFAQRHGPRPDDHPIT